MAALASEQPPLWHPASAPSPFFLCKGPPSRHPIGEGPGEAKGVDIALTLPVSQPFGHAVGKCGYPTPL